MNESEVEEHRIESGEEFLLITAKVIYSISCESESVFPRYRTESGEEFLLITANLKCDGGNDRHASKVSWEEKQSEGA